MKMKKILASILAAVLILCSMPLSAFAQGDAAITLGSNAVIDGTIEADGVEFTYYAEINGIALSGDFVGSDSNTYSAVGGYITLPYDVTVEIPVSNGESYSLYRCEYDNPSYALIDETYPAKGTIDLFSIIT